MDACIQDAQGEARAGHRGSGRMVSTPSTQIRERATRHAQEKTRWALQLLRRERQPTKSGDIDAQGAAELAEVAESKKPARPYKLDTIQGDDAGISATNSSNTHTDMEHSVRRY